MTTNNLFSRKVSVFHDRVAPEEGYLAGYALLMDILADEGIQTPLPDRLTIISEKHHRYANDEWLVLTPRHRPDNNLKSHLFFALRYEGVDLYILKNIFRHSGLNRSVKSSVMSRQVNMQDDCGFCTSGCLVLLTYLTSRQEHM